MGEQEQDLPQQGDQQRAPAVPQGLKGGGQDDAHRGNGEREGGHTQGGNAHSGGRSTGVEAVPQQGPGGQGQQDGPATAADRASCAPKRTAWERRGRTSLRSYS